MRMVRVYCRLGWGPTILGAEGVGRDAVSVGLWAFEEELRPRLLEKAGVTSDQSRRWHALAFGASKPSIAEGAA